MNIQPEFCIFHPSGRGTGSAVRLRTTPAIGSCKGCLKITIASQKIVDKTVFPSFDWDNVLIVELSATEISQLIMTLRGHQESINEGKGLFFRDETGSTVFKFGLAINPVPGYVLEIYRNPYHGEAFRKRIIITHEEAMTIDLALAGWMPFIVFGSPTLSED